MMQKRKTQNSVGALSGLQGVFNFEQNPSSLNFNIFQLPPMRGYQIDSQCLLHPIWEGRHHG